MPVANPVCNRSVPKLPIPPKSQKIPGARNKTNTGTHWHSGEGQKKSEGSKCMLVLSDKVL